MPDEGRRPPFGPIGVCYSVSGVCPHLPGNLKGQGSTQQNPPEYGAMSRHSRQLLKRLAIVDVNSNSERKKTFHSGKKTQGRRFVSRTSHKGISGRVSICATVSWARMKLQMTMSPTRNSIPVLTGVCLTGVSAPLVLFGLHKDILQTQDLNAHHANMNQIESPLCLWRGARAHFHLHARQTDETAAKSPTAAASRSTDIVTLFGSPPPHTLDGEYHFWGRHGSEFGCVSSSYVKFKGVLFSLLKLAALSNTMATFNTRTSRESHSRRLLNGVSEIWMILQNLLTAICLCVLSAVVPCIDADDDECQYSKGNRSVDTWTIVRSILTAEDQ